MGETRIKIPLTHAQRRIYMPCVVNPASSWPVIFYQVRFMESVDLDRLANAIHDTIENTDTLRTRLVSGEQLPWQEFPDHERRQLTILDFRGRSETDLDQWAREQSFRTFDLFDGPLVEFTLIRYPDGKSGYTMRLHHICVDGISCIQLVRAIVVRYRGKDGVGSDDAVPLISCGVFGESEQTYLVSAQYEQDRKYWLSRNLHLLTPFTLVPPRSMSARSPSDTVAFPVPAPLMARMMVCHQESRFSPFVQLLSALSIYIHRVTDQDRFGLSFYGHGRSSDKLRSVCGMAVETLPLAVDLHDLITFRDLLGHLSETVHDILKHHGRFPFDELVRLVRQEHGADINHLINLSVIELVYPDMDVCEMTQVHQLAMLNQLSVFLERYDRPGRDATIRFTFDTSVYSREDMEALYEGICTILEAGLDQPELPLSGLSLLSEDGVGRVVHAFNRTEAQFPKEKCVHHLFEAVARCQPDADAIEWGSRTIGYGELDRRADELADMLRGAGVGPEKRVAVFMEKSIETVVAFLAVLKAGGAYVPIDPHLPAERVAFLLSDSAPAVVVCGQRLRGRVADCGGTWFVCRDEQFYLESPVTSSTGSDAPPFPDNLMYIIYTSGSTGKPKGVLVEHRGFVNLVHDQVQRYGLSCEDRFLHFLSFSFDAAQEHLYRTLCSGAVLCLADMKRPEQQDIRELLRTRRITCCAFPASTLAALDESDFPHLLTLSSGADKCSVELFRKWSRGRRFFNAYGPTEVTVLSTISRLDEQETEPHIGKPIANLKAYVLDRYRMPVPVGVEGELYLGGVGVARGYLNRPEETAAAFQKNPFDPSGQSRLYRTGDICRWRSDGNLVFIGRKDRQIKIRGFRVELDEINVALLGCSGVTDAAVLVHPAGNSRQLAGFVVGRNAGDIHQLAQCLRKMLPEHMVPERLSAVSEIPRTFSGKVNEPVLLQALSREAGVPTEEMGALTCTERNLRQLWSEYCGNDGVGLDENFFFSGGDSLSAIQLCIAIEHQFGIHVSIGQFMQHPTIRGVAAMLDSREPERGTVLNIREVPAPRGTLIVCHSYFGECNYGSLIGRRLDESMRVLGVCIDLERMATLGPNSVQDLAAFHVDRLLEQNLNGPLLLCGLSWSGLLAYEMALQLEQQGFACRLLLLDTKFPSMATARLWSRLCHFLFHGVRLAYHLASAGVYSVLSLSSRWKRRNQLRINAIELELELYRLALFSQESRSMSSRSLVQQLRLLENTPSPPSETISGHYIRTRPDGSLRRLLLPDQLTQWNRFLPRQLTGHFVAGAHNDLIRGNLQELVACVQEVVNQTKPPEN